MVFTVGYFALFLMLRGRVMGKGEKKSFFMLPVVFLLTAGLLLGALLLATFVPKEAIAPRMLASAEYLCEDKLFKPAVEGVPSTRIDHYADAILLGIAWQYDKENALRSVLESSYYHLPYQNENKNLLDAVRGDLPANQQYLRYWHGSAGIVRILMSFLDLQQIYLWHGILMGGLFLALLLRLIRRRERALWIGLLVAVIGNACWFVPLSLEYTWVFLILLIQLHLVISRWFPKSWGTRCIFLMISGMVTNYLDFLTCETLTVLVPLLVMLWLERTPDVAFAKNGKNASGKPKVPSWRTLLTAGAAWLIGYAGMFLAKWLLAGLVMGENPFPYVLQHIEERTIGSAGEVGFWQELLMAPLRNISNLFPLDYGILGAVLGGAAILCAFYAAYVYRRKDYNKGLAARLAAIGAVPYLRYLMMANHSYLHVFFTYRAQFATLLAATLILGEVLDRHVRHGNKKGSRSMKGGRRGK